MSVWTAVLVGLAALLVSALGGWPLTAGVLRWAARTSHDEAVADRPTPSAGDDEADEAGEVGEVGVQPATGTAAATGTSGGDPGSTPPAEDANSPVGAHARAVLRGGMWIGLLERIAVTGCLVAGYPGGVAFVIAVKGLGRYPELRENPEVSERFVIGTLTSMLWAGAVGIAARAVLMA